MYGLPSSSVGTGDRLIGDLGITLEDSEQEEGVRRQASTLSYKTMAISHLDQQATAINQGQRIKRLGAVFALALVSSVVGFSAISSPANASPRYWSPSYYNSPAGQTQLQMGAWNM